MGATKEKLLYVLDILKETDEQHPLTTAQIIEKLKPYSIEPERKSVLRDIEVLKDHGYDVELSEDNKLGFYLGEREFEDWELKVLIDAVQSAKFLPQADTDKLVEKLCSLSSAAGARTLRLMTIPADAKRGDSSTKRAIDAVLTAIRKHRKVHFDYVFTDDDLRERPKHPEGTKPVSPYALIWRKDKYYLIGNYSDDATLSYYRLDRIRSPEILEEEPARSLQDILGGNAEYKLREFVRKNVYNKKGESVMLRLRVLSNGADTVMDSFGDDVRVRKNEDGTLNAVVSVSDSEGLYTWLLHHGREVTVLEPERVRTEMKRRLEAMLMNYEEERI